MLFTPGTYICVSTPGLASKIIEFGTRSRVSHAAIITEPVGTVAEAEPGGVRLRSIDEYAGRYLLISPPEGTAEQRALAVEAAQRMVGTPYNYIGIVDDGLESLGVFWKWFADVASADLEVLCSQMVTLCGRDAGFDWMCGKRKPSEVTPADLARRPGMRRLIL